MREPIGGNGSPMRESPEQLAVRYHVEDQPGAISPGTRLSNILCACAAGSSLSEASELFLESRGLRALIAYAKGEIGADAFVQRSLAERAARQECADRRRLEALAQQEAQREKARAWHEAQLAEIHARQRAEQLRRERDPRYVARRKGREQREKYGIYGYVEQEHFSRVMAILRCLDDHERVVEAEMIWLETEGREYRTEEVLHAHHRIEADVFLAEYRATENVWKAVTASGHLRKCGAAQEAHELLSDLSDRRLPSPKLKSAVRTTHGGALRDLGRREEAIRMAEEAHALLSNDFRPCTLLGAIYMEQHEIALGHEWYCKAEARGAPPKHVDSEIRSILMRLPQEQRGSAIEQLLAFDPSRYDWLKQAFAGKHEPRKRRDRRDHGK